MDCILFFVVRRKKATPYPLSLMTVCSRLPYSVDEVGVCGGVYYWKENKTVLLGRGRQTACLQNVSAAVRGGVTWIPQADEPCCGILELKTLFLCPTCQRSAETFLVFRTSILSSAGPGQGGSMVRQTPSLPASWGCHSQLVSTLPCDVGVKSWRTTVLGLL